MLKKSVRRYVKLTTVLLIAVFALMSQSLVAAQTSTKEVEFVGTISTMTTQTLTLGNQTFDIAHAEITAGVVSGALVKIHATPSATGIWVAREVELARVNANPTPSPATTPEATPEATQQPTPQGEFEITGQITALTTTTIVVGGQTIDISSAEIKDALALNEVVKVHVSVVDGVWVAREVEAASITVTGTGTPTFDRRGRGDDDGPDHDANDDHGDHNGNDDAGHQGSDDNNQGSNNDDSHGGNNSGSDDGNSGHGGNGSGGHGHG